MKKAVFTFVCIIILFSLILIPTIRADTINVSANVTQLWKFMSDGESVSSPVVVGGLVYTTSWNTLYCINASTGTQLWSRNSLFIRFTVANGYVYLNEVPQGNTPGDVSCLNAFSGAEIWKFPYATSINSPVVRGNIVYVAGYSGPYPDFNHGFVYALDASSGRVIWQFTINSRTDSLAVSGDLVFVTFHNEDYIEGLFYGEGICGLDATTGRLVWNIPSNDYLNRVESMPPIIQSNKIFLSYNNYSKDNSNEINGGGVYALEALSGTLFWHLGFSESVSVPTVTNNACYMVVNDSSLYALDLSNGGVVWNYSSKASLGSPLFFDGYLFIGTSEGVLCLNEANGQVIWNFNKSDYSGSSATNPTFSDGVIYVGWNGPMFFSPVIQHDFYALNAANGASLWNYNLGYTGISSYVVDGTVYLGTSWVTTRSPDMSGPGAVIALKSNVASLPLPSVSSVSPSPSVPEFSWLTSLLLLLAIPIVLVVIRRRMLVSQQIKKC